MGWAFSAGSVATVRSPFCRCSAHTHADNVSGTATVNAIAGIATPESLAAKPTSAVTREPVRPALSVGAYS